MKRMPEHKELEQKIETHLAGLSALAQKSIADKIKKDQFDDIMGLYNRQLTA